MRFVFWDSETHPIKKGQMMPRLVCVSWSERSEGEDLAEVPTADSIAFRKDNIARGLLSREAGIKWLRKRLQDDDTTFIGQNIAYDFGVAIAASPDLLGLVFEKYRKGLVRDTIIRQQLIDIATGEMKFHLDEDGEPKKTAYDLAALSQRLLNKFLRKKDTWRLRYAELDGVPLTEWPEEAVRYAIDDSVTTELVYEKQAEIAGGEIPNSLEQHRASWALHLMSAWGIRTDGAMVRRLKAELEKEFTAMMDALRPSGLLNITPARVNRKGVSIPEKIAKSMKAIRARVEDAYLRMGDPCPQTEGGQTATDKKTLKATGDADLIKLAEAGAIGKLLQTYIPVLESGTQVPINPRYNTLVETGRTSCSRPNCFDGETEVLTREGWQRFDAYTGGPVAQFDPGSLAISFVEPTAVIVDTAPPTLTTLYNEHINLRLTDDHRCLLRNRKRGTWIVASANDYPSDYQQLNAGVYAGGEGLPFSDPELVVLCATQADGSYHEDGVGLDFGFMKERKATRLRDALSACAANYSENRGSDGRYRFRVNTSGLVQRIKTLLGPRKCFGSWVLDMSRSQLDFFVDEVFRWDGCVTRMNHFASSLPVNADWVQIAITLSGRRAKVRQYNNSNPRAAISHQVDVSRHPYSLTTNIVRDASPTTPGERVYCVSVPSSYLVVRRGGAAVITGNCQNPPRKGGVRECFIPRDGWVYAFSDYDTLELRSLAQCCLDMLGWSHMAEALRRGEDLHLALAAEMLGISLEEATARFSAGDAEIKEYRQQAKPANFGFPGGMAAESFREYAEGYGITLTSEQSQKIHATWKTKWAEMGPYFEIIQSLTALDGPITQLRSGRVRGGASYCAAANGFFQGLAADGAKDALWLVALECYVNKSSPLYGCRPVFFIHDEIGIEIPIRWWGAKRAAAAAERLATVMIEAMKKWIPDVPISAKPIMVRRWFKGAEQVKVDGVLVPCKPVTVETNGKKKTTWVADLEEERAAA